MKYTKEFLSKIYEEIISDKTIKSMSELGRRYGLSPNKIQRLNKELFKIYDRDYILSITRSRMGKYGNTIRNSKVVRYSNESKLKMSKAQKKRFETDEKSKEISKQNMIKYCAPKSRNPESRKKAVQTRIERYGKHWCSDETKKNMSEAQKNKNYVITDETRKKMSKSAKNRGYNLPLGFKHSDKTKKVLSKNTKKQWIDGCFDTSKFKSKLQIEIANEFKKLKYKVKEEYRVKGKPYDIFIKDKNLLIEVNGTYWHYDPRFYESGDFDKSKKRYVDEIWKYDEEKIKLAENEGYEVKVIWQYDWENGNKNKIIKDILT